MRRSPDPAVKCVPHTCTHASFVEYRLEDCSEASSICHFNRSTIFASFRAVFSYYFLEICRYMQNDL